MTVKRCVETRSIVSVHRFIQFARGNPESARIRDIGFSVPDTDEAHTNGRNAAGRTDKL